MSSSPSGLLSRFLMVALATTFTVGAIAAQDTNSTSSNTPNPSNTQTVSSPSPASINYDDVVPMHWEIFGGYSWLGPSGHIGSIPIDNHIDKGFIVSAAYFFNRYAGLELSSSAHFGDNDTLSYTDFGPILRLPTKGITPFVHAGLGIAQLAPRNFDNNLGFSAFGGGGLDLTLPRFQHLKFRLIQADYIHQENKFFPLRPKFESGRISAGIVYAFSPITPPIPPTVACAVSPNEVFPGDPLNVTVTPSNFNPKRTVTYSYNTTGGKVTGTGATTTVDTAAAQPGNYTVTATASDGKMKIPATCSAAYTVKAFPAPTVSCSANPTEIDAGGTSTINANGATIKGNLKYNYTASAGTVQGDGPNATLNAAGAQPGPITVTCNVTDDRGQTASATTTVTVRAPVAPPAPPPPPEASKVNEIAFTKPYASRVDNTAKAILDDVALRLQREPDSKLVIVGATDAKETSKTRSKNLAGMRANNTKAYLVDEKGIDASRIETRTDGTNGMKSELWIVPNGATFNQPDTQVVTMPAPKPAAKHHRRAHKPAPAAAPAAPPAQ